MSTSTKITILVLILVAAVFGITAQFIKVSEIGVQQPTYTTHTAELTRDVLVGQTFRSAHDNLSGVAVMFATFSGRSGPQEVNFYLREGTNSTENIRQVSTQPIEFGDNQLFRFDFEPIVGSHNKEYFFYVTAPDGAPGRALSVSISSQDPYHLGSAYIVQGKGPNVTNPTTLTSSGKQALDLAFQTYHQVPLNYALIAKATNFVTYTRGTWSDRQAQYMLWVRALIPALLFILTLLYVHFTQKRPDSYLARKNTILIAVLIALAITWRILYAKELPVINDEGNYLYDARTLLEGKLAGGDGYVKAPLVILWLALWQFMGGTTILASRMSSVVIGAFTLIPLYFITRELKDKSAALLTSLAWAVFGAPVVFNIYILTQPLALFFAASGIAVLWLALRGRIHKAGVEASLAVSATKWFFIAGILLGLGVASRKSILAVGLVPLLLILAEGKSWKARMHHLVAVGAGFLLVMAIFMGSAYGLYGEQGVIEAIGINSAEDSAITRDVTEIEAARAYSLRGMTPFFRESLPLIMLSLIGWGFMWEKFIRDIAQKMVKKKPPRTVVFTLEYILPKIGWLFPLAAYYWAFNFFFEYEGSAFHIYGLQYLWYAMGVIVVLATIWPRSNDDRLVFAEDKTIKGSTQPARYSTPNTVTGAVHRLSTPLVSKSDTAWIGIGLVQILLLPIWLAGLAFFYMNWIKFHANYTGEFLLPIVVYAGIGASLLWMRLKSSKETANRKPLLTILRRVPLGAALFVSVWAIFVSSYITYLYEHTGTFGQAAAYEAAQWATENIPADEPIFTGAALIPFLSNHHVALDIAHPRWYAYQDTRTNPERLNTFLPPIEEMLEAYRSAHWFLHDAQTGFSFMMEYTEIEAGLASDWRPVHVIENGGNPLTFYQRVGNLR